MSNKIKIVLFSILVILAIVIHFSLPTLEGNKLFLAMAGWALIFKGIWDILDIKKNDLPKEKINIKA